MNECKPLVPGVGWAPRGLGRAVQVEPLKPKLNPPGIKRSKLKYDNPLSRFALNFNLRRYNWVYRAADAVLTVTPEDAASIAAIVAGKPAAGGGDIGLVTHVADSGGGGGNDDNGGRGLLSSTFQLNLSRFGQTSPCPHV